MLPEEDSLPLEEEPLPDEEPLSELPDDEPLEPEEEAEEAET